MGDAEVLLYLGRPHRVLIGSSTPFSLLLLSPEGSRDRTRKEIKFSLERLVMYSAWELSFRGTRFQVGWL